MKKKQLHIESKIALISCKKEEIDYTIISGKIVGSNQTEYGFTACAETLTREIRRTLK